MLHTWEYRVAHGIILNCFYHSYFNTEIGNIITYCLASIFCQYHGKGHQGYWGGLSSEWRGGTSSFYGEPSRAMSVYLWAVRESLRTAILIQHGAWNWQSEAALWTYISKSVSKATAKRAEPCNTFEFSVWPCRECELVNNFTNHWIIWNLFRYSVSIQYIDIDPFGHCHASSSQKRYNLSL